MIVSILPDIKTAFELTVQTAVQGHHIYKETWRPTIDEEFVAANITAVQEVDGIAQTWRMWIRPVWFGRNKVATQRIGSAVGFFSVVMKFFLLLNY